MTRTSLKVLDVMTRQVCIACPDETIQQVAERMATCDVGFLPVVENGRVTGIITDRDVVVRGVACGRDRQARVREAMTSEVCCCSEDDCIAEVARIMTIQKVRRLPVLDREKRLVGVVSLSDVSMSPAPGAAISTLGGISRPGGVHS